MITIDYKRLNISPGDRILDMGCGPGRHVSGACAGYEAKVVGADINIEDLLQAKTNIFVHEAYGGKLRGTWGLSAADITALPFADTAFDHVICSEVLEHIPDDQSAAKELFRVLKPGGTLTVSVPRFFPEKICWTLSAAYCNTRGGHIRIYKKKEIIGLFESLGLKKRFSHHSHSIHTPYWWLKCLVGPENETALPVALYNRFLTWDIMEKPRWTRAIDFALNPVMGKSFVAYFTKSNQ
ncbi:MAG: class I SAM-dependent methyltransferase [Thermodesulfobacteriota bacterium]